MIIPALNEEKRLPATLETIRVFLNQQNYLSEVLVVDSGSSDRTLQIAQDFAGSNPVVRVLHEEQRGKGRAVRAGMLAARGKYRFFGDADLSMPIEEINRFLPPQLPDPQVVIASREVAGSVRYGEPEIRHLSGRVFNTLVRWIALPGLQDTQCGFKLFRDDIAEDVFQRQTIFGWTFDVEVLYIARLHGYTITEVGVPWYYNADSKVRMWQDAWNMVTDLIQIRRNARRGVYDAAPAKS
ncbi:MAG: glycosyltransferase family 2 protein [Chloroflexi bacterium]|nr:MAG: glycosyltransferase family 2 protein [Chloroflexota bacterium]